jgi:hypothetical protein
VPEEDQDEDQDQEQAPDRDLIIQILRQPPTSPTTPSNVKAELSSPDDVPTDEQSEDEPIIMEDPPMFPNF